MAAIQLAVRCSELCFARCCALKRTGPFSSESKVTCLFKMQKEKLCDDVNRVSVL